MTLQNPRRGRGRPTDVLPDETRAQMLRAARTLFSSKGYADTSVAELMEATGVTSPVLYHHFGSKAGLFVAAATEVYEQVLDRFEAIIPLDRGFDAAIDALLDGAIEIQGNDPTLSPMVLTVLLEVRRDELLARQLRPVVRRFRAFFDDLARLAPPSLLRRTRGEDLARALISIVSGLNTTATLLERPHDFPNVVGAVRLLLTRRPQRKEAT